MSTFSTAYDTVACQAYAGRIKMVETALKEADAMQLLKPISFNIANVPYTITVKLVCGGHARLDSIANFNHPVYCQDQMGKLVSYVDARNFGRWDKAQSRFRISNQDELLWQIRRAVLQHLWINEPRGSLRDISILPMKVYANVIAETLERRFALNPAGRVRVATAAAYGYLNLFTDGEEADFDKTAVKISQALGSWGREQVDSVLSEIQPIAGLEDLCEQIKAVSGSVRLEEFNYGMLMTLLSGSWYGNNSREVVCVGLEHIPTWIMMIWSSVSEATFKRSTLAKLVQQYDTRGVGDSFDTAMRAMLGMVDDKKLLEI